MLERLLSVYILCAVCVTAAETLAVDTQAHAGLNTFRIRERIVADGFPAETHEVTTIDKYILEMHRIPHGRGQVSGPEAAKRPIVFLMHGLLSASDAFIGLGADYSLAYNLADAGFDVWMGNARGNRYSRRHQTWNPDDEFQKFLFFDFTFEEIGLHDLPAMMDYALEHTGNQQLHYIGHSQGGTVYLVLMTLRPEYNVKIASAHLLAGVGYQEYFPDKMLAASAADVDNIYSYALENGIVELYPEFLQPSRAGDMSDECTGALVRSNKCNLDGVKRILANNSFYDAAVNVPPGASLKQAAHYGQNIRDKLFRRYHFGVEDNKVNYGLEEPPLYKLGSIISDVTMHYSMSDNLLDERDVLAMVADMPNARARRVARDTFGHSDYVASLDAKELVTDYIIDAIKNTPIIETETSTGVDPVSVADNQSTSPPQSTILTSSPPPIVGVIITTAAPGFAPGIELNMSLILLSSIMLMIKEIFIV